MKTFLDYESFRGSGMPIAALVSNLKGATIEHRDGSFALPQVYGIRHDSRRVCPGEVFLARKGASSDGNDHIMQAVERGACAVMVERGSLARFSSWSSLPVPVISVDDARDALAQSAKVTYGDPSRTLPVIGITGTNGKTTTAWLLWEVLKRAGHRPAMLGTFGLLWEDRRIEMRHNTPEADALTRVMAWLFDQGASHLIMEVTSHALACRRVDGVRFRVAAFTNLTHDHLDLHGSIEAYGRAKARLFWELQPSASVLMVDDPFGTALAERASCLMIRVSRRPEPFVDIAPESAYGGDLRSIDCPIRVEGNRFVLRSMLFGEHNVANLLLALGVSLTLGLDPKQSLQGLACASLPPGRLERCEGPEGVTVFVDYAHTPDGLEKALLAVRAWAKGRVICVFGCGGDRDGSKREPMGRVASRHADVSVVTSDNPRGEDPEGIVMEVRKGFSSCASVHLEIDRAKAIEWSLGEACPGDVVLIAGKGHETVQVLREGPIPFDDRDWVKA